MLGEAITAKIDLLEEIGGKLASTLATLNDPVNFSLPQALSLAALIGHIRPDVVIDLGTGRGNSAATAATALNAAGLPPQVKVHTFDLAPNWAEHAAPHLSPEVNARVVPQVGDLTKFDFAALLGGAQAVVLFWDAHGHDIADKVLAQIMPMIASKRHVVLCHDIVDARLWPMEAKRYGTKPLWRGMSHFYNVHQTDYLVLGWAASIADQIIPIMDFCARNGTELQSCDQEVRVAMPEAVRSRFDALCRPDPRPVAMALFTLNGVGRPTFPPSYLAMCQETTERIEAATRKLEIAVEITAGMYGAFLRQHVYAEGATPQDLGATGHPAFTFHTVNDHLATDYFAVTHSGARPGDPLVVVLDCDWSGGGRRAVPFLQDDKFVRLSGVETTADGRTRIAVDVPAGTRLRIVLVCDSAGQLAIPSAMRVGAAPAP